MLNNFRNNHQPVALLLPLMAALFPLLSTRTARAHIDVDMGGTHMSRVAGGYDIKAPPCGVADAPRGMNVYKYRPGATITIKVYENISHPGYFRISFDNDGDDGFVIPTGTSGENGDCGGNASCGPGKEDYCSNETVLMDNIDPHAAGEAKTYTWSVKLPDVECTNCTLQIIQMMNDFAPFHSPASYPADDIYYHCIDLELSKDAPETTDTPVETKGMVCAGASTGAAGAPSTAGGAGASGGGAAAAAGAQASAGAGAGGSAATDEAKPSAGTAGAGAAGSKAATTTAGTTGATATTTTGSAGAKAAASTGNGAGPAAGSGASNSSGSTSSAVDGTSTPAAAAESDSGGCQAAGKSPIGLAGPMLLGLFALGMRRYGRRQRSL